MIRDSRIRHWALAPALAAALLAACGGGSAPSATNTETAAAVSATPDIAAIEALRVPEGAVGTLAAPLRMAKGPVDVWVSLAALPVSLKKKELRPDVAGVSWKATDATLKSQLQAHKAMLKGRQDTLMSALTGMGASELGRVLVSHNAVAVTVDAARLADIAALPDVVAVRPVRNYELMLGETVPYVGGAAAQAAGKDGTGTVVAVLDSGIDYTHRNMGGAGTDAAYANAWGAGVGDPKQTSRDGLFPTAKVVAGFDFVGEAWPTFGPRTEDDDPIDLQGHGTHVADIIAGIGPNKGMAPGAKLVAVKVCSAVATSCNGVALIKGMDYALDPNGDGDLSDAVDVINLSLGSSFGQDEDDLSFATANAVKLGVSVVASAGNSANRPYIVGSPSSAPGVLSVAQTQVPSAVAFPLVVTGITPSTINNTALVDWAPVGAGFSGPVVRAGTACPGQAIFNGNALAGKVALIDRGSCNISLKVDVATKAGAIAVLLANNAAGDPPSFSFGGGDLPLVPTVVITQADGTRIKAALGATGANPAVVASVSPATSVALVGSMVASSSRGPGFSSTALKPEIGAPGASVSAEATTGTGETAFGGTSGASPMVAGAAAILRGAYPDRTPGQIKAMLMNSANTVVYNNPATQPGVLAPISRIGAGELRVDRALGLTTIAHNVKARTAALPFGFAEVDRNANLGSELLIENFGSTERTYTLSSAYRYADDAAAGATTIEMPATVTVPAGGAVKVDVRMKVDGAKLPAWGFAGRAGSSGGDGSLLEANEVDGYVTVSGGSDTLTVPFHALLRKSSSVAVTGSSLKAGADFKMQNNGVNAGFNDFFALTGTSPQISKKLLPESGDNFAVIDLRAVGVRPLGNALQFAVSRWDRRAHPAYPAEIDIYIDSNNDGVDDFVVYNSELTGFATTGQTVVNVANLRTGVVSAFFFLISDLQSGTGVYTVPLAAVGLTPSSKFRYSVYAFDNYFTGNLTDAIENMTYTLDKPRFALQGGLNAATWAPGESFSFKTSAVAGGAAASPSQSGFMIVYRANKDNEADLVTLSP